MADPHRTLPRPRPVRTARSSSAAPRSNDTGRKAAHERPPGRPRPVPAAHPPPRGLWIVYQVLRVVVAVDVRRDQVQTDIVRIHHDDGDQSVTSAYRIDLDRDRDGDEDDLPEAA